ncbi:MAG: hypothetical protein IPM06_22590 [Rhizobiales bacterium]|nr:hypothetical protein [Hyphomicrobiales bacterium]
MKTPLIEDPAAYWQRQAEKLAQQLKDEKNQRQYFVNYARALESLVTFKQRLDAQEVAGDLMRKDEGPI